MSEPSPPEWPRTWYIVARSSDIGIGGILDFRLGKRECVIFRTEAGVLAAIDAHCPHIGAHLRHGNVLGDSIRCPLHGWLIGADGAVGSEFATCVRSNTWPVAEQHGLVFLHLGNLPAGPAPLPESAEAFGWTADKPVDLQTHWHDFMAKRFDLQHLQSVHHREVIDLPPRIERDGRSLIWSYVSRVTGGSVSDRLTKWLSGDRIHVRMRCYGSIITFEVDLHFTRTAAIVGVLPRKGGVRALGTFGVLPGPFPGMRQWLARTLHAAFLARELKIIEGAEFRSANASDPCVRALLGFLRELPDQGA